MAPGFSASAFTTALRRSSKLAAELGAGEQRPQIEGIKRGFLEDLGDLLLVDGDRQPLGQGRLSHACLSDVDGVCSSGAGRAPAWCAPARSCAPTSGSMRPSAARAIRSTQ